jgi:hypothetical protein
MIKTFVTVFSRNFTQTTTARGTNCKVDIKNCLTWLAEVVDALHEKGIFHDSAVEVIETAPKN